MTAERALLSPSMALTLEDVKVAQGPTFVTEGVPVSPATEFAPEVNDTTRALCTEAAAHQQAGLVHMQRRLVNQIPTCRVSADRPAFSFTVYGEGRRVSAPDYPAQHCCGYPKVAAFLGLLLITVLIALLIAVLNY